MHLLLNMFSYVSRNDIRDSPRFSIKSFAICDCHGSFI